MYSTLYTALTALLLISSENKPKNGGICVANHTSPIDVIILASDGCYAMVTILLQNRKLQLTFSITAACLLKI